MALCWLLVSHDNFRPSRQLAVDFLCFDVKCLPALHCCNATQLYVLYREVFATNLLLEKKYVYADVTLSANNF